MKKLKGEIKLSTKKQYIRTPQEPIFSGFGKHTTAKEVLEGYDLGDKICIVTGGYSGIGLETTRALAEAGATVIVPARTIDKARVSLKDIPRVELEELDLINPDSIDSFAQRFLNSGRKLDILINNAGIVTPLIRDSRGYESQFATNHLGHFQLTARLWTALKQARSARVICVSSSAIMFGGVDFTDPNFEQKQYDIWKAYGQAKSANALFALALDKLGYDYGIRAFSLCPGSIETHLTRDMTNEDFGEISKYPSPEPKTAEQGAATSVWCATSSQLEDKGGVFCSDVDIAKVVSSPQEMPGVLPWAIDPTLAKQLWHLSEDLTGIKFTK